MITDRQPMQTSCRQKSNKNMSNSKLCPNIPHDVVLTHIFSMMPQREMEDSVMRAIESRNLVDLYTLLGRTPATVPRFLSRSDTYAKAAGLTFMLPVLHRLGFQLSEDIFEKAAANNNNMEILTWLRTNDCPWDTRTFGAAAKCGNLDIMKWLQKNDCPWDEWTFMYAAECGNLVNMKWLKAKGCPWYTQTFVAAAKNGNLEVMAWLKANNCPWNWFI